VNFVVFYFTIQQNAQKTISFRKKQTWSVIDWFLCLDKNDVAHFFI